MQNIELVEKGLETARMAEAAIEKIDRITSFMLGYKLDFDKLKDDGCKLAMIAEQGDEYEVLPGMSAQVTEDREKLESIFRFIMSIDV